MDQLWDADSSVVERREFLRVAFAGVCGGLAAPSVMMSSALGGTRTPWKLRLSTSSIHYAQMSVENACERVSVLGFDAVDIWSAHAGCPHLDDVLNRIGPAGLIELLTKWKLGLCAFSVYQGGFPLYAELLGAVKGGVAIRGSTRPCAPQELTARMRDFLESLKPEIELAEQHDSYLAIENHGDALLDSLDSFKAFVDLNTSPRVGIALAPYHLQARNALVEDAIIVAERQLIFFYAWQHATGLAQLPGHGPTDFTPWITALARISYQGYVNPFMHGAVNHEEMSAALEKSRDYLRECHASVVASD